ncbi:hypothetical protein GGP41_010307 [Bipolaris sorokiniana]|uniref:Uncharacterized protein n=1 Tax=Cochliobolus sativus TaxID=45130 RepID=A0A8H5ZM76_COCSA|nr:hypothetical protein GGP41_010307 [Bipolaris sorokiniana]
MSSLGLFGPQIEDFAAQGRLKSWRSSGNAHATLKPKPTSTQPNASPEDPTATSFQCMELVKYVAEINLGPISFKRCVHFAAYKMPPREDASA